MSNNQQNNDPRSQNLFTGKGGEAAVMSELLFWGFNASILPVDYGVDVAAIKNEKTYLLQVKTRHSNKRRFSVILEVEALRRFVKSNVYTVSVGRSRATELNEFIILPVQLLNKASKKLKIKKNRRGKPAFHFLFNKRKDGKITLFNFGDVTQYINAWHLIK